MTPPQGKATCKTCGATVPNHVPSPLDKDGVGAPGHKMEQGKANSELEALLTEFLGEYHDHKCVSNCGNGCINCRQTGYNQTPCLMCDKDGIAFRRKRELVKALEALCQQEYRRGQIDELMDMRSFAQMDSGMGQYIIRRFKTLKAGLEQVGDEGDVTEVEDGSEPL